MWVRTLAIHVGAIAVFGAIALGLQFPKLNQSLSGQTLEETRKAVREESTRLKLIRQLPPRGFGFNNMIADFTFLQFLQYFGDDVSRISFQTGYVLSPNYFDNIIERDPKFLSSYVYLSSSVSIFSGIPREAINLYDKGLRSLNPDQQANAYFIWRYKATDQLLFLGDGKGARESYLKAAEWAEQSKPSEKYLESTKMDAESSRQSAKWLEEERDLSKAQFFAWSLVLQNAADKKTLEIIAKEVDKIGMQIEYANGRPYLARKNP